MDGDTEEGGYWDEVTSSAVFPSSTSITGEWGVPVERVSVRPDD